MKDGPLGAVSETITGRGKRLKFVCRCAICGEPIKAYISQTRDAQIEHFKNFHPLKYARFLIMEADANHHSIRLRCINMESLTEFGIPIIK